MLGSTLLRLVVAAAAAIAAPGCATTVASLSLESRPVMLGPLDRVGGSPSAYAPTSTAIAFSWKDMAPMNVQGSPASANCPHPDQVPYLALAAGDDLGVRLADLRAGAGNFYVIWAVFLGVSGTASLDGVVWTEVEAEGGPCGR